MIEPIVYPDTEFYLSHIARPWISGLLISSLGPVLYVCLQWLLHVAATTALWFRFRLPVACALYLACPAILDYQQAVLSDGLFVSVFVLTLCAPKDYTGILAGLLPLIRPYGLLVGPLLAFCRRDWFILATWAPLPLIVCALNLGWHGAFSITPQLGVVLSQQAGIGSGSWEWGSGSTSLALVEIASNPTVYLHNVSHNMLGMTLPGDRGPLANWALLIALGMLPILGKWRLEWAILYVYFLGQAVISSGYERKQLPLMPIRCLLLATLLDDGALWRKAKGRGWDYNSWINKAQ